MKNLLFILAPIFLLTASCNLPSGESSIEPTGFILIPGVELPGGIVLDDFEIMDHPVTNSEYKVFIDDTNYPPPQHWIKGNIPAGKEDYPVIFINREDVQHYIDWLIKKTGRICRLPSDPEFVYAAMGRIDSSVFRDADTEFTRHGYYLKYDDDTPPLYYWGNTDPHIMTDSVNFNDTGERSFGEWERYLKPARWGMKNSLGLYQMAGNVWSLISNNRDIALARYKYRIEEPFEVERDIAGGSWARPEFFLRAGVSYNNHGKGSRHPDVGFRLVREPEGQIWKEIERSLVAVDHSPGKIGLNWALLKTDHPGVSFNVYRIKGIYRSHKGQKINPEPVTSTSWMDQTGTEKGVRYQYRVVPLDEHGKELNPSEWVGITAGMEAYPVMVKYKPLITKGGDMTPVFGNLEGYGRLNCVIRLRNGNYEMSQDPGIPVQLEAFSFFGKSLWRKDVAYHENIYGSASNCPFNVWDMDGDGKDEVITLLQIDEKNHVAILDGMTGKVMYTTPWSEMATDIQISSTRVQMSIGYLDGKTPAVITMTGVYENEVITAYDNKLNKLWEYKSFGATGGSGAHIIEVADLDGDGKQEVIYGTTALNHDGSLRWSTYLSHADKVMIHDFLPERHGLEVAYTIEMAISAGVYMVDGNTGEIIWKNNWEDDPVWSHAHDGWAANIYSGSAGMEIVANQDATNNTVIMFSSEGRILNRGINFLAYTPVEWDGDETRELLYGNGTTIAKYNGEEINTISGEKPNPVPNSSLLSAMDLVGDFRSELVISAIDNDGRPAIMVITNPNLCDQKYVTPRSELDYRLYISRNGGGGYAYKRDHAITGSRDQADK